MSPEQAPTSPSPQGQRVATGILLAVAAATCFAALDSLAKGLAAHHHPLMLTWSRYAGHFLLMLVLLGPRRRFGLVRTGRPGFQLARGVVVLGASTTFFSSLVFLPLATAAAISFVAPLVVTALSVPLLGERVGPRRWAAVLVGFAGMLIVMRPDAGFAGWATLLPLVAACCNGSFQIMTRIASRTEAPLTSLFYPTLVGTFGLGLVMPFVWSPPTAATLPLLALTGVFGGLGHYCLILALGRIEASVAAPFGYIYLVQVALAGYLFFDEVPDAWTLTGGAVICASGLYVLFRETRRRRGRA